MKYAVAEIDLNFWKMQLWKQKDFKFGKTRQQYLLLSARCASALHLLVSRLVKGIKKKTNTPHEFK